MMPSTPVFLILCGVGLCSFMSYNLVRMPALAPFAESLGAGPVAVGFIVAASTLTGVFLKLPMGALSDVVSRRRLMLVGVLAFALPPFAYPLVPDLETLAVLRVIHGLATAVFTPLVLASVASMYPMTRGAALGWYTSAAQGGALLGPMLGGWLVDTAGFTQAFLAGGGFGLVALALFVIILFLYPEETPMTQKDTREVWADLQRGLSTVIGHSQMLMTSLAEAAKMMASGTLMAFLPLYALSIGLSLTDSGLLFGIQGLTSFLSKPVMGRVSDQVGRRPLITLGLVICGVTIMSLPYVTEFLPLLGLAAGFGFGEAVITSSSAAFIADLAAPENIGAGMGLRGTIMDMGHAGGPVLAGVLVATISYTGAFTVLGGLQFVAAWGFWLMTYRSSAVQPV
ncbi:MFS transporter [Candidatus Nitronereus thalassa]|uniref:MFS transporter n=1 Tax=Candidatus Nitronereus thalassa TaxID=3020898 RepID=A0ABU3KCF3_9BACT|nr:MFS transporter [Candidatus Nitronereus thalassa]MDT7043988.1 MFS transporter [Candidatus Nitronereus thalassa]